jgi:hypothetical protein
VSGADYCFFILSRQSWRSVPVIPAHFELASDELAPAELESLELPVDELLGEALLGEVLEDELLGEGDEAPPALELEPLSLADDPLDDAPPAAPPLAPALPLLAPALAPPPAPALPPLAPPPCAHDTVARPSMAAVIAALISFSFIAWVPLGLGWDELRGHPRKNNAPGSNGLSLQAFSAR